MSGLSGRVRQLLAGAWLAAGRARARGLEPDRWENRFALVDRLAPGRSFLDLGGMWNVDGEVAFRAERAGATRVVLFDGMDPTPGFEENTRSGARAWATSRGTCTIRRTSGGLARSTWSGAPV